MPHATDPTEVPTNVSDEAAGEISRALGELRRCCNDQDDPRGWTPNGGRRYPANAKAMRDVLDRIHSQCVVQGIDATDRGEQAAWERLAIELNSILAMTAPRLCWPILRRLLAVAGLTERADEIARPGGMGGGK